VGTLLKFAGRAAPASVASRVNVPPRVSAATPRCFTKGCIEGPPQGKGFKKIVLPSCCSFTSPYGYLESCDTGRFISADVWVESAQACSVELRGANAVDAAELAERLSRIKTRLTVWLQAHEGQGEAAVAARQQLVLRYYGAVYRYLLGMLRDPTAAEELTQDFAVRFLRGDFRHFDPQRGRFRDFLKTALRNLVMDYWRQKKQRKEPQSPPEESLEPMAASEGDFDKAFAEKWREELLARTWEALEKNEEATSQPYYTVLRCKTEEPELRSAQLATRVSARLGKPLTGENLRQLLHRARRRFAELLVEEVARSLESAEPEQVTLELIDLGLLGYCRSAVQSAE
jgi:RNA polymerase sigma-70 factor (ECF subfamily)